MFNKPVQAGKDGKKLQNKDKYKIKSQIFLAFFDNKKPHKNAGLRSSAKLQMTRHQKRNDFGEDVHIALLKRLGKVNHQDVLKNVSLIESNPCTRAKNINITTTHEQSRHYARIRNLTSHTWSKLCIVHAKDLRFLRMHEITRIHTEKLLIRKMFYIHNSKSFDF